VKQRPFVLKLATLASSLTLVTGFIAYRAGALNRLIAGSPPLDSSANSPTNEHTATQTGNPIKDILVKVHERQTGSLMFMVGSKSDAGLSGGIILNDRGSPPTATPPLFQPVAAHPSASEGPQPDVTVIMSSTKSSSIISRSDLADTFTGAIYNLGIRISPSPCEPATAPIPATEPTPSTLPAQPVIIYGTKAPNFTNLLESLTPAAPNAQRLPSPLVPVPVQQSAPPH
jgi:hypothetical protein